MLYIIYMQKKDDSNNTLYKIFDTHSESLMSIETDLLTEIILNTKMHVVNASIQNGKILVKNWINGIYTEVNKHGNKQQYGSSYVLIRKEKDEYKLVDIKGDITYYKMTLELKDLIRSGEVANCIFKYDSGESSIETEDVQIIHKDTNYEQLIDTKYTQFINKTRLLGYGDMSFTYTIEGQEVRLEKYTGTSKDIIMPSFVTAVRQEAFILKDIKTLRLNEGLKIIGTRAFASYHNSRLLGQVEIPSTVEMLGAGAFYGNDKLFDSKYNLNTDRFKIRNNKTIILKQHASQS